MEQGRKIKIRNLLMIIASASLYALNMNAFVHAGNLTPGGFSGLSLLIVRLLQGKNISVPYGFIYILFNIPCTVLVYKHVGKRFTFLSLLDVILVSILVEFIPEIRVIDDQLLIAVFGGIVNGAANALVLMAGASGGGTDFIAIYFAKIYQRSMWHVILAFNAVLLLFTGFFFGWETALYSIIFQYASTQIVEMLDKRYKRSCFFVVTEKPLEVMDAIRQHFLHNSTELRGTGYYSHTEKKIVYAVVGKYEQQAAVDVILSIDPDAFINIMDTQQLIGRFNQLPY